MNKKEAVAEIKTANKEERRADLSEADLSEANLSRADLRGAHLSRADLRGAYLRGAKNIIVYSGLHEWLITMVNDGNGPRMYVGCHSGMSISELRVHWMKHSDQQRRDVCIPILDGLEATAKGLGWIE